MKTQIDLVDVRKLLELKRFINGDSLDSIDWYDNGVKIEVPEDDIDEWKYTGLANLSFAELKLMRQETNESN